MSAFPLAATLFPRLAALQVDGAMRRALRTGRGARRPSPSRSAELGLALLTIVSFAWRKPLARGTKRATSWQLALGGTGAPQPDPSWKSPGSEPLNVALVMASGIAPRLVTVTFCSPTEVIRCAANTT